MTQQQTSDSNPDPITALSDLDCLYIEAGWYRLEDGAVDIGQFGNQLNQIIQSGDTEKLLENLIALREQQQNMHHDIIVAAINKAIFLCQGEQPPLLVKSPPKKFEVHLEPHNDEYFLRIGSPNIVSPPALKEETFQGPLNWCLVQIERRLNLLKE